MLGRPAPRREADCDEPDQSPFFRWERDMIAPLTASLTELAVAGGAGARHVLTEVATVSGVPDMVVAHLDERAISARLAAGMSPVVDFTQVRALIAIANGHRSVSGLAGATGVSPGHLRGSVLPTLAALGWVTPLSGRGRTAQVEPLHVLQPLAHQLMTVEAKKSAWQRAVNQAMRHTGSADASYIALDAARASAALEQRAAIARLGVGVLLVNRLTSEVRVVSRPRPHAPHLAMRAVLAERAWQLVLTGQTAGPSYPVFGRNLHAV
jgi:hypothetical protein